jgi:hypothetical protein
MKEKTNYIHQTIPGFIGLCFYGGAFWWPQWKALEVICWIIFGLGTLGLLHNETMRRIAAFYQCNWFYSISVVQMICALSIFYFNRPQAETFGIAYLCYLVVAFIRMMTVSKEH